MKPDYQIPILYPASNRVTSPCHIIHRCSTVVFPPKSFPNNMAPHYNYPLDGTVILLITNISPGPQSALHHSNVPQSRNAGDTHLISTLFASKYAINPAFPDSRPPFPLSLRPPNGVLMVGMKGPFTKTDPASRLAETRRARVRSEV
jgi:hypothetical protein